MKSVCRVVFGSVWTDGVNMSTCLTGWLPRSAVPGELREEKELREGSDPRPAEGLYEEEGAGGQYVHH